MEHSEPLKAIWEMEPGTRNLQAENFCTSGKKSGKQRTEMKCRPQGAGISIPTSINVLPRCKSTTEPLNQPRNPSIEAENEKNKKKMEKN